MADETPPSSIEDRVSDLEGVALKLIADISELKANRLVVFATFGGFAVMLSAKGLMNDDDVDRLMDMVERIAAEMEDLVAQGIEPEDWLKTMPRDPNPRRRRSKRKSRRP